MTSPYINLIPLYHDQRMISRLIASKMVSLKSVTVLLLASQATAIPLYYRVFYYNNSNDSVTRQFEVGEITEDQARQIRTNIYLWSQGNFAPQDSDGRLYIYNVNIPHGFSAAQNVHNNMKAALAHHLGI